MILGRGAMRFVAWRAADCRHCAGSTIPKISFRLRKYKDIFMGRCAASTATPQHPAITVLTFVAARALNVFCRIEILPIAHVASPRAMVLNARLITFSLRPDFYSTPFPPDSGHRFAHWRLLGPHDRLPPMPTVSPQCLCNAVRNVLQLSIIGRTLGLRMRSVSAFRITIETIPITDISAFVAMCVFATAAAA